MRGEEILSPYQGFLQSALQGKVQNCWQKWNQEALSKRNIKMLGYLHQSSVSDLTVQRVDMWRKIHVQHEVVLWSKKKY